MAVGTPKTPGVDVRCHFVIKFTTQFHKLNIMRDSKIPAKQRPFLGDTTRHQSSPFDACDRTCTCQFDACKKKHALPVYDTYCLGHWNKENARTKTPNFINLC